MLTGPSILLLFKIFISLPTLLLKPIKMANTFKYTADTLKFMFEEYKQDMQNYHYLRPELIKGGDYAGQVVNVKIPKPYSVVSFCAFAEISTATFYNYCNKDSEDFNRFKGDMLEERIKLLESSIYVCEQIKDHQIGGATAGIYNANIVARVNGIGDNVNVNNTGTKETININIDGKKVDLS